MLTYLVSMAVSALVGWLIPQPVVAKIVSEKLMDGIKAVYAKVKSSKAAKEEPKA